ncbi:hypothetical protein M3O96_10715 [Aquiflexum sp. TKW24L]|uniref:hypothetical protein n=1 Tax=Aquiflexum sp. TKW24L TaxID=2942212 RepID=UPI0020BE4711|nr:hypothetical protein [Aquiflexum sp. TKW24L]MCL6259564.1 hypothetical protein [Aquiflexum sp. TKW24L]
MKRNLVILSLVAAMGLMLTSQAIAQSSQGRIPFGGTFDFCGELIDLEGEIHVVANFVESKSGNVMSKFHYNLKATGVGQTSGAAYQANETVNQTINGSKGFNETVTISTLLIGQGKAPNYKYKVTFHITVNANGELTAEVLNESVECK